MEVITTILLGAVALLGYLVNANNNAVLKLKNSAREKEFETKYLLDEKDSEIANLNRQLQIEKNKFLRAPNTNGSEILKLNKELTEKRNEVFELQRKLREKENSILDLNRMYNTFKDANNELRRQLVELEQENSNLRRNGVQLPLPLPFPPPPPKTKKFVRVVFKGYSNKEHDYLLGNHKNIKIGDIVLVGTKNGAKQAKVVYVSQSGEVSEYAKSEIIKKVR